MARGWGWSRYIYSVGLERKISQGCSFVRISYASTALGTWPTRPEPGGTPSNISSPCSPLLSSAPTFASTVARRCSRKLMTSVARRRWCQYNATPKRGSAIRLIKTPVTPVKVRMLALRVCNCAQGNTREYASVGSLRSVQNSGASLRNSRLQAQQIANSKCLPA